MTRREIPLDASAILAVLAEHGVNYVVIGGLAVQVHGHPRTTQDVDLVPEPEPENLERLRAALEELGARPVGATSPHPVCLPQTGVLELDTDAGGVDVHLDPPGAAPYAALRSRALELRLEVDIAVAGLDDLIANETGQRSADRPERHHRVDRAGLMSVQGLRACGVCRVRAHEHLGAPVCAVL